MALNDALQQMQIFEYEEALARARHLEVFAHIYHSGMYKKEGFSSFEHFVKWAFNGMSKSSAFRNVYNFDKFIYPELYNQYEPFFMYFSIPALDRLSVIGDYCTVREFCVKNCITPGSNIQNITRAVKNRVTT